jgi:hypothetical protein
MSKKPHVARQVRVSKNLCNYPLARDARQKQHWRRSAPKGTCWYCELPGDDRIQWWLPYNIDPQIRHCPTAFDINLLLRLLAHAQQHIAHKIRFGSHAEVLRLLQVPVNHRYRQHLRHALRLWRHLSLRHRHWHKVGQGAIPVKLAPPIERLFTQHGLRLTLNRQWIRLGKDYFSKIVLPLPNDAATQNLILLLSCHLREQCFIAPELDPLPEVQRFDMKPQSTRIYCDKIGLQRDERTRQLRRIIEGPARRYYEKQGITLLGRFRGDKVGLTFLVEPKPDTPAPAKAVPIKTDAAIPRLKMKEKPKPDKPKLIWVMEGGHGRWMREYPDGRWDEVDPWEAV